MIYIVISFILSFFTFADEKMFDISLELKRTENILNQTQEWWMVNQTEPGPIERSSHKLGMGLEVYVFSDQVSPPSLGFLAGYG